MSILVDMDANNLIELLTFYVTQSEDCLHLSVTTYIEIHALISTGRLRKLTQLSLISIKRDPTQFPTYFRMVKGQLQQGYSWFTCSEMWPK